MDEELKKLKEENRVLKAALGFLTKRLDISTTKYWTYENGRVYDPSSIVIKYGRHTIMEESECPELVAFIKGRSGV